MSESVTWNMQRCSRSVSVFSCKLLTFTVEVTLRCAGVYRKRLTIDKAKDDEVRATSDLC